ncbi:uncharacterized protein LOC135292873 isoform X1 [Passer domesticus]|uniref:uncharacterized protein LOC135292873 isoform X1 n=1 Tax=Passer domesticus TaxID=48849 RepID=UPI0030FEB666
MGFQEVLMNDGLKFLEDAGAEPAGEGPTSRTEALGYAEGVSAGRTFIRPLVVIADKPSSHGRGKMQDTSDKISLEPSKQMRQVLKELLQTRQEIKGKPMQKEAFPGGSSGSMPASAPGREVMPGTVKEDEVAGKASPLAWMNKVSKPLEPPADVSTGRTSPAPTLDAVRKPSSHHRGSPTRKILYTTDKISLEQSKQRRQELKELLQTRQEMDIVLQWKVAFLEGSTPSSVPAIAAGRKAKPDTGTGTADWEAGKDSALAWRSEVVKPSGHSAGVSAGTTSPTPTLDDTEKPSSHGRGPTTGETKDMAEKKFQDPLEIMWQMLKECLQRRQEIKGEPVQKEAFARGSSGSMPASAPGREAMPGTGTRAEPAGEGPTSRTEALGDAEVCLCRSAEMAEASVAVELQVCLQGGLLQLQGWVLGPNPAPMAGPPKGKTQDTAAKMSHDSGEFLRQTQKEAPGGQVMDQKAVQKEEQPGRSSGSLAAIAAGKKAMTDTGTGTADAGSTTRPVPNAQDGLRRGFCQGTSCWLGLLGGMLYLEFVFMMCCIGIWYSWNRKQSTSGQELEDGGCTSHPDSSRNGLDSPLKCSVKRTPEQPSTRKPLIAP